MSLDQHDLVIIQKALGAYSLHLGPSSEYSDEVRSWSNVVDEVRHKVISALLEKNKEVYPLINP